MLRSTAPCLVASRDRPRSSRSRARRKAKRCGVAAAAVDLSCDVTADLRDPRRNGGKSLWPSRVWDRGRRRSHKKCKGEGKAHVFRIRYLHPLSPHGLVSQLGTCSRQLSLSSSRRTESDSGYGSYGFGFHFARDGCREVMLSRGDGHNMHNAHYQCDPHSIHDVHVVSAGLLPGTEDMPAVLPRLGLCCRHWQSLQPKVQQDCFCTPSFKILQKPCQCGVTSECQLYVCVCNCA